MTTRRHPTNPQAAGTGAASTLPRHDAAYKALFAFPEMMIALIRSFVLEPFVRGASLGISPWEEIVSSVAGFALMGGNGLGLILGPVVYIVGKKVYRTMHPELAGRGTTGYFDRGFGQKAGTDRKEPEGTVIDITDDVEEVREEAP